MNTNTRIVDYACGFILLWEDKPSVVATDANAPRRREFRVRQRPAKQAPITYNLYRNERIQLEHPAR